MIGFEPHQYERAGSALRQLGHNRFQKSVEIVCSAVGAAPGFGKLWPFATPPAGLSPFRPAEDVEDNPFVNKLRLSLASTNGRI